VTGPAEEDPAAEDYREIGGPRWEEPSADPGTAGRPETAPASQRGGPGQVAAWSAYNWADHAWAAAVAAVLAGPWMLALAKNAVGGDRGVLLALGPLRLRAEAYPSAMVTLAAVVQLFVLLPVGVRADARQAKRRWLAWSCGAGSLICGFLALTSGRQWVLAGLLFLAGSLIEGVSDLTWQGMLPEIAGPAEYDAVSSRGTAVGYLGAAGILAVCLVFVDVHHQLGLSKSAAVRICFLGAGIWWAGFGLFAIGRLRPRPRAASMAVLTGRRQPGLWAQLRADLRPLGRMPQTRRYLLAYFCIADATSAVIALASTFLTHQLFGDNTDKAATFLFELILLVQVVAIGGAVAFGQVARRIGAKWAVVAGLGLWCAVIVYSYASLDSKADAVVAGVVIGVALGGTTALGRSLFARMVPAGLEATFFSIFEACNQGTAWIAPLLFTIVVDVTGSFRQAILSLVVLFAAGMVILVTTDCDAAAAEALAYPGRPGVELAP
jgi:MFS transporter, UMF1 family